MHRQLAGAVPAPDGEMAGAAAMRLERAAMALQKALEFSRVHECKIVYISVEVNRNVEL